MKVIPYQQADSQFFDSGMAKGVTGRVVIGRADGAPNFCMRVFELAPQGFTPRHAHSWEHEIFFHSGSGEIYEEGRWLPVKTGSVAFIPGNQEHQIRNTGTDTLVFVCLIPKEAPEL